jgi:hypothetical protein
MCINSCAGFTGSFEHLTHCPICNKFCFESIPYEQSDGAIKIPWQTFSTILLGPQLQALWQSQETAKVLQYRVRHTHEIIEAMEANNGIISMCDDVFCGSEYIEVFQAGHSSDHDTTLLLSLNGAKLYEMKVLECWIYIWIIYDFDPQLCYKKKIVFFGGIFPELFKPKHFDFLLYPGIHHLSALQCEGFQVWDAFYNWVYTSHPFFYSRVADGPGVVILNSLTGHIGYYSCHHYCPLRGCCVPQDQKYYPVHLKPWNYILKDCNHPNVNLTHLLIYPANEYKDNLACVVASTTTSQYSNHHKQPGIIKPSLEWAGIYGMLSLPGCFLLRIALGAAPATQTISSRASKI